MKTDRPPVGIDHPTVVPENFVPPAQRGASERAQEGGGSKREEDTADSAAERLDWELSDA